MHSCSFGEHSPYNDYAVGWMVVDSWFGAQQGQGIFSSLEHPGHIWACLASYSIGSRGHFPSG